MCGCVYVHGYHLSRVQISFKSGEGLGCKCEVREEILRKVCTIFYNYEICNC